MTKSELQEELQKFKDLYASERKEVRELKEEVEQLKEINLELTINQVRYKQVFINIQELANSKIGS